MTGTFILDTILFLAVARSHLAHARPGSWSLIGTLFLTVEIAFFTSNLTKVDPRRVAAAAASGC